MLGGLRLRFQTPYLEHLMPKNPDLGFDLKLKVGVVECGVGLVANVIEQSFSMSGHHTHPWIHFNQLGV